jgi:hypothetical protein
VHGTATYRCDDTRDCIIQFCPSDDEHLCSKHVEAWNKLIIKFSASSWLILINKHEYHCWNLKDNRAVVRIFIALLRLSRDTASYLYEWEYMKPPCWVWNTARNTLQQQPRLRVSSKCPSVRKCYCATSWQLPETLLKFKAIISKTILSGDLRSTNSHHQGI